MFKDLSLLKLKAVAEDYVWGKLMFNDWQREQLRSTVVRRFAQVEALNRGFGGNQEQTPERNS